MRDGNWKYLEDEKGEYLFDLSTDPYEKADVKGQYPDILQNLRKKYLVWEGTVLKSFLE